LNDDTPGPDERPDEDELLSAAGDVHPRSLYRHPIAAVGGALILAGGFAFVVLAALDLFSATENPYRALITFVGAPVIILIGIIIFLIGVRIQIANARRRGEDVRFNLRLEFTNARFRRSLWLFAGLSVSFVAIVAFAGVQGFEATDSSAFCGETCHTPMEPQAVAHEVSAHAEVECVACHIGEGGASWVEAKVNGIRQLWGVVTGEFNRPIHTPVEGMSGADELCETCHWPDHFKGEKFVGYTHYGTDEDNSPWTVNLLLNVGGGPDAPEAVAGGIHFHMFEENQMEYIAADDQRQDIAWLRVTDDDGNTVVYRDPDHSVDPSDPEVEVRSFDCLDCHNRPAHQFDPPGEAIDLAMVRGEINSDLPYVKKIGLELLNARYQTKEQAFGLIRTGMRNFYDENYPNRIDAIRPEVEAATEILVRIYEENFFPETNTDYRVRVDNVGHWVNDGCFRCHNSDLETEVGARITSSCESCHVVVGQGPTDDPSELMTDLGGLQFQHPVDIGELWQKVPCTQCHSPYAGY
jgi:hypothetical protein